ncbi:hypothetical protein AX16_010291 [Volvariella volvacea WC 439]|nr:hypothetical protein AX16_010291 [Volvariella volvacea WC 439]
MRCGVSQTQIMDLLGYHERKMGLIDAQITELYQKARRLQYQKRLHQQQINLCRGAITLATRMPHEILASIFTKCVQEGYTLTPLIVSHVCSHWRRAAIIPSVWSHIYVDCDAPNAIGRTRFWLSKAQTSSLLVTIEVGVDSTQTGALMGILLSRSHQWKQFTLRARSLVHVNQVLASCSTATPKLVALDITIWQDISPDEDLTHQLSISFPDAPRLSSTALTWDALPARGILPISTTDLSLTLPCYNATPLPPLSISGILDVLEGLPFLSSLSLIIPPGRQRELIRPPDSMSSIILGHLKKLTLVGVVDLYQILSFLMTPVVTHLRIRHSLDPLGYPHERLGADLRQYLRQSSPPLEVLELHDIDIPFLDLSSCLSSLASLRELHLHESELPNWVLKMLNGPDGYCPLLSRLNLRWCGSLTGSALVELIRSRLSTETMDQCQCSPIDELTIVHCAFVREQDIYNLTQHTTCRMIQDADDYCHPIGCCQNERYRKRLVQRMDKMDANQRARLIL